MEALLNRCIAASAQASALARQLHGTSLQIEADGVARIRLAAFGDRLALLAGDDSAADAVIRGSPPALLQLFRGAAARGQGTAAAQIRGDAEIANRYRELLVLARPDWEEEMSRWIGDMPARHLSQLAEGAISWARRARRSAGENLAEYLQEEGRDLASKPEIDEFLRGVDELREAADRMEARLQRLEQRSKGAA